MQAAKTFLLSIVIATYSLTVVNTAHAIEPLDASALTQTLNTLLDNSSAARRTTLTLKVVDLETGEVLYDRGGDRLLIPASNLKIYTAAAALDLLGPDYTWTTQVGAQVPIRDGVSSSDLVIGGTGDPMLDTEQLSQMANELVNKHKLTKVYGGVSVATSPRWQNVPIKGPGWMWDDDPDYYNMSIRSVMLNFNTLDVVVSPSAGGISVVLEPATSWPPVVVVTPNNTDDMGIRIERESFEEAIHVTGVLKPGSDPVRETITMHDPFPWIASVFKQMLEERGVKFVTGCARDELLRHTLTSREGENLAEALRHFLKVSENAVGEMVLLKLAETQTDGDVSWPAGAKVITDWLTNTAGLEPGSFRLVDGSGLSRYNLISADSSVKLLAFMKTHKHFAPFFDGLPIYKVPLLDNETWNNKPITHYDPKRVFAKTGGMTGVSTISGYIKTLDNQWLAFSFLANGYTGSSKPVKELRNEIWTELIRYSPTDSPGN